VNEAAREQGGRHGPSRNPADQQGTGAEGKGGFASGLVAPTSRGGWALAGWNGSPWFDLWGGRVLDPQIYVALATTARGKL